MKKLKYYFILSITVLTITSCTKVIDLKLNNASGQLVIEGNVTNIYGPQYVKLTKNVPFTNTNTYPPVTGATITIDDQHGNNYTLTEAPQGTYSVNPMTSITGNTYVMTVKVGGQTYIANSTMPQVIALDSVTSKISAFNSPKNGKNEEDITVHYQDPGGVANQYRFVMYVNGVQVKSIFAFDDEFTDGRLVSNDLREDDINIYTGDTVKVEMQCIDKPIYTYWYTLMQQEGNGPGGSVAPANPPTNIMPATLGYFSVHSTQTKTIIVK
jgi:hypothetical protein